MARLTEQYRKQRRRIQQAMRREAKRGAFVPDNILPAVPKRITKASVARLEKITPETIRKKSYLVDAVTGEAKKYIPPKGGTKRTKKVNSEIPSSESSNREARPYTVKIPHFIDSPESVMRGQRIITLQYDNWLHRIRSHAYGEGAVILERFFSNWENTIGREETVSRVNQAILEGMELQDWILYHTDGALNFINDILIFFPTAVNKFNELTELFDYFEEWEDFKQ